MEIRTRNYDHYHMLFSTKDKSLFFKLEGLYKIPYCIYPFGLVINIVYEN